MKHRFDRSGIIALLAIAGLCLDAAGSIFDPPTTSVSRLEFEGNTFVSPARLRTQVDSISGGQFSRRSADQDVVKLEEYYRAFGYHQVNVTYRLKRNQDLHTFRIIFHIHEGARSRLAAPAGGYAFPD